VQALNAAPSSAHSNDAPGSEVKLKSALLDELGLLGCALIVVSGAVLSIVQAKEPGLASVLPAASLARTEKLCSPSARPEYCFGLVQASYAALSRAHSKLAPGSELKPKTALVEELGLLG
jgi:hypothetical protein